MQKTHVVLGFLLGVNAWAGVTISSPQNGATVSSPVQLSASITGSPASVIVYDNNSVILSQRKPGSSIQVSLNLSDGPHTVKVRVSYRGWSTTATSNIKVSTQDPSPGPSPDPSPDPSPSPAISLATQIAADMQGKNEGYPHGVPLGWDWATGPAVTMGNNANGWKALTAWGVVYEAAEGNPATNSRVNLRNVRTLLLQKSNGKWLLLQNTSKPDGAAFLEDFSGDISKPADIRQEPDGTISVTAGGGYNFHLWPSDRASINPDDIGGIVVVLEARLISANPNKADDRSIARYLCGAGADYYPALTGSWPGNETYNPAAAIGKEKYVKSEWRSFAMTTLTEAQLKNNPPPINLDGVLP